MADEQSSAAQKKERPPRDSVAGPDSGPAPPFPLRVNGKVIAGFGRGSKELGIPTANIPLSGLTVGGRPDLESGIYYGWCGLIHGSSPSASTSTTQPSSGPEIYPMVLSLGYNPYYNNTVRSLEVHILHSFPSDFYGSHLNLVMLGYIRPEFDYIDRESLIADIMTDIDVARKSLARESYERWKDDEYLRKTEADDGDDKNDEVKR